MGTALNEEGKAGVVESPGRMVARGRREGQGLGEDWDNATASSRRLRFIADQLLVPLALW